MTEQMLPERLCAWLVNEAQCLGVPLEYVAIPALVCLATVVGRQLGIHPHRRDDWLVIPNLWGALVAPPGSRKTPAINAATRPLRRLEEAANEEFKKERIKLSAKILAKETERKHLQHAAGRLATKGKTLGANATRQATLEEEIQYLKRHTAPRFITSDATTAKLGAMLAVHTRGLLLLRDELHGWLTQLNRDEFSGDRQFYLSSWSGDVAHNVDRVGRGEDKATLVLSICGGIQPGRMAGLLRATVDPDSREDDGLMQRLQLLVWPAEFALKPTNAVPDDTAYRDALALFVELDRIDVQVWCATMDAKSGVPALRFSTEREDGQAESAQDLFESWEAELYEEINSETVPVFKAHMAKYNSLCAALAELAHLANTARPVSGGIPYRPLTIAINLVAFLKAHARRAYASVLSPERQAARALADRIQLGKVRDGMTARLIEHRGWTGLARVADVYRALEVLEAAGWVRLEARDPTNPAAGGRPPSESIRLHPDLRTTSLPLSEVP